MRDAASARVEEGRTSMSRDKKKEKDDVVEELMERAETASYEEGRERFDC